MSQFHLTYVDDDNRQHELITACEDEKNDAVDRCIANGWSYFCDWYDDQA